MRFSPGCKCCSQCVTAKDCSNAALGTASVVWTQSGATVATCTTSGDGLTVAFGTCCVHLPDGVYNVSATVAYFNPATPYFPRCLPQTVTVAGNLSVTFYGLCLNVQGICSGIAGQTVKLYNGSGALLDSATTDSLGKANWLLPAGTYRWTITPSDARVLSYDSGTFSLSGGMQLGHVYVPACGYVYPQPRSDPFDLTCYCNWPVARVLDAVVAGQAVTLTYDDAHLWWQGCFPHYTVKKCAHSYDATQPTPCVAEFATVGVWVTLDCYAHLWTLSLSGESCNYTDLLGSVSVLGNKGCHAPPAVAFAEGSAGTDTPDHCHPPNFSFTVADNPYLDTCGSFLGAVFGGSPVAATVVEAGSGSQLHTRQLTIWVQGCNDNLVSGATVALIQDGATTTKTADGSAVFTGLSTSAWSAAITKTGFNAGSLSSDGSWPSTSSCSNTNAVVTLSAAAGHQCTNWSADPLPESGLVLYDPALGLTLSMTFSPGTASWYAAPPDAFIDYPACSPFPSCPAEPVMVLNYYQLDSKTGMKVSYETDFSYPPCPGNNSGASAYETAGVVVSAPTPALLLLFPFDDYLVIGAHATYLWCTTNTVQVHN